MKSVALAIPVGMVCGALVLVVPAVGLACLLASFIVLGLGALFEDKIVVYLRSRAISRESKARTATASSADRCRDPARARARLSH